MTSAISRPVLAPGVLDTVMRLAADHTRLPDAADQRALASLTPGELVIAQAVARGASNAEISAELFLSIPTVKTHVSRVLGKLGVESRTQAAALLLRAGRG